MIQLFDAPFLVGERVPPFVMLAVTKDQQLFKKAYDDFSDLDRDGITDTTYNHGISYYGHFDSFKCYVYDDGDSRFEPVSINTDKYCSGNWSGNFLNWATMTRMDALRKVLFGGLRSPERNTDDVGMISDGDTATSTVIERAFLPNDAHSFTKYYAGPDTDKLTPFPNSPPPLNGVPIIGSTGVAEVSIDSDPKAVVVDTSLIAQHDWVQLTAPNGSYVRGRVTKRNNSSIEVGDNNQNKITPINMFVAPGTSPVNAAATGWTVTNIRTRGLTFCNTTDGDNGSSIQALSETNTNLPRMKVAIGDYSLWNAGERWQCRWQSDKGASNGNDPSMSGLMAFPDSPKQSSHGIDSPGKSGKAGVGEYFVRTQVCVPSMLGTERCKQYPSGNYKPVGLLQSFGESDRIRFGLMTGSYKRNLSGGVLRKNISPLNDEINVSTDGTFIKLPASGVGASPAPGDPTVNLTGGSIIRTLSSLRIAGYSYKDGTYFGSPSNDACPYQRALDDNGECKSWGNPMSEIYYESLRYLAGQAAPTPAFSADDTTVIANLATATWPTAAKSLLSEKNYCTPLNVLVVNGAVSTNEQDGQVGSTSFMAGAPGSAVQLTNNVGSIWGLSGSYFYGNAAGSGSGSPGYQICSGKTLTGLGEALGICPEGPTLNGSYLMAGLAHHAHTNRVRTDITLPASASKLKRPALHVDTFGVSIAGGIPRIPVKFKGETEPRVVIQPAYRLTNGTYGGGGALVDARIIRQIEEDDRSYGQIMVSWEDSEAGGDYDMDVWGLLSYEMDKATKKLRVTTDTIYDATANPQGFGYVLSGTDRDGLHFHSGVLNFSYTDPMPGMVVSGSPQLNASGGCKNCYSGDAPTTAEYNLTNVPPAKSLEDPLYYASLFGGFEDANGDKKPSGPTVVAGVTHPSEYDKRNNNTGADSPDGIPDNYFKVDNPLGLELSLERTFQLISEQSSLSSLQASSTRISTSSNVFQAKFNSGDWSGSLEALPILTGGAIGVPLWNAASASLNAGTLDHANRVIYTLRSDTRLAVPFRYSNLAPAQQTALNVLPGGSVDGRGLERISYLRGDNAQEGSGATQFRRRVSTVLGDIVNSNPAYVGKPSAGIGSASYMSFISTQAARTPMIYVGANDGMLHGFSAVDGKEVFAYVPSPVIGHLNELPAQDYSHRYYVDGQLTTQDVQIAGNWRTYLVGGLGRGGQGVFGLDVTNPAGAGDGTAGQIVKWEFTDADDPRMGYLFSTPIIRKSNSGEWYAIFSSGFNAGHPDGNSTVDGRAAIFMLKMSGPTAANGKWQKDVDYIRIDVPVGSAAIPNGIGGVASFDKDGNGTSDLLYAGDLQGNLWTVDITSATATVWDDSGKQRKLFSAIGPDGLPQAITAPPSLAVGPNYTGAMVVFGTGKLLEPADLKPGVAYPQNTLYGIWDKHDGSATVLDRSKLMQQKELAREANTAYAAINPDVAGIQFSLISSYVPNYTTTSRTNLVYGTTDPFATGPTASTAPQMGWFMDEPNGKVSGERSIYRPELVGPFAVFVNAIPSTVSCEGGGSEAQYVLETLTGGRSTFGGFDRDASGSIQAQSGSLLGDQSKFSQPTPSGQPPAYFFASRRETTGGFGQMTVMADTMTSSGGGGACAGAGLAPIGAQSFSSGSIGTQRLPGGCIGRVQWREVINH
jgi:type IV pilus assembly protein PilY1